MIFFSFLLLVLFLPVTMLLFGAALRKCPPKEINPVLGYRTRRSMASEDAWRFANTYAGKYWFICGLINLPLAIAACLVSLNQDFYETVLLIFTGVQLVVLLSVIPATERALKKNGF